MSSDVLVLLRAEHKELRRLVRGLPRAVAGSGGPHLLRRALDTVAGHLRREGEALGALTEHVPGEVADLVRVTGKEAQRVEGWRDAVDQPETDEDRRTRVATELEALVRHHVDQQESRLFPEIRRRHGRRRLVESGGHLVDAVAAEARAEAVAQAPAEEVEVEPSVTVERVEPLTVVRVAGAADEASVPVLRRTVLDAVAGGGTHLVIDLGGVTRIDAAALRVLVEASRSVGPRGSLHLVAPEEAFAVRRALRITGLHRIFSVVSSVAQAHPEHPALTAQASTAAG